MRLLRFIVVCALLCVTSPVRAQVTQTTLTFPAGRTSVDLPATFHVPHIYVRVTIAGRGLDFVLDTGAGGIVIDPSVVQQLGIPTYGSFHGSAAQSFTASRATVLEMQIGDLVMHDVTVSVTPISWNERRDVQVMGLLGYDFLRQVGLTIDYAHRRVTAMPSDQYIPPPPGAVNAIVPMHFQSRVPMVTVTINGVDADRMIIDTGAATDMMLFDYLIQQHPEVLALHVAEPLGAVPFYRGVGGTFSAKQYRLAAVDFGRFHITSVGAIYAVSEGSYTQQADGVIGPGILYHFTLGFDFAGGKLYLSHNSGQ